jgi:hypothetical protein
MGTNYYLRRKPCKECKRLEDELHIGKSSAGWCFGLHVIPEEGLSNLKDWVEKWKEGTIFDEYGRQIKHLEMLDIITNRGFGYREHNQEEERNFHKMNHSEPGPNNLVRSKIDRVHCIGHGLGTWDFITGEFS